LEITGSGIRLKARLVQIKTPYYPQKRRPARLRNTSDLTSVISLAFSAQLSANCEVRHRHAKTGGGGNRTRDIALGYWARADLTSGVNNIAIGNRGFAGESNHIRIGTVGIQRHTFLAGISGATVADGVGVVVGTDGHLGTVFLRTL